jgi:hypothetical protein
MPYTSKPFKFDPKARYGGRQTTYHELTAWVMKPIHPKVRGHAQPWNKATNAMIQYQIDQIGEEWTAMKRALEIARRPFWWG